VKHLPTFKRIFRRSETIAACGFALLVTCAITIQIVGHIFAVPETPVFDVKGVMSLAFDG
jgi:hypothetical protein